MGRTKPAVIAAIAASLPLLAALVWFVWTAIDPRLDGGDAPVNEWCPVLPDERADEKWQLVHRGRIIAFCCDSCVETFKASPDDFTDALERAEDSPIDRARDAAKWVHDRPVLSIYLAAIVAAFGAARLLGGERLAGRPRAARVRALVAHPAAFVIALQAGLLVSALAPDAERARAASRDVYEESRARLQLARGAAWQARTPQPANPLARTFYRGNNERGDELGLGGRYRTADLSVSIVTDDGTTVAPGDDIRGVALRLRLEIVRAPFAAPELFTPRLMSRVMLTRKWDAEPDDAAFLTTLELGERWQAFYSLGTDRIHRDEVVVLLRLERATHYAIMVDVELDADGVVQPTSNLVLGSVINFSNIAREEWISLDPIPVLTGENTDDARLLGLGDYEGVGRSSPPK